MASLVSKEHTGNTADAIDDIVNHLLANGVVPTGVVVGRILLAIDQKLGVEQLAVGTGADFVDWGRVQVDKDGPGDVFAVAGLGEESLERTAFGDVLGVRIRATIRPEPVLEEIPESTS